MFLWGYDLGHEELRMRDRIHETSLGKPSRDKTNNGWSIRIAHKVFQHVSRARLPQHAQTELVCLATIHRYFYAILRQINYCINLYLPVPGREKIHSQFL